MGPPMGPQDLGTEQRRQGRSGHHSKWLTARLPTPICNRFQEAQGVRELLWCLLALAAQSNSRSQYEVSLEITFSKASKKVPALCQAIRWTPNGHGAGTRLE
eukprot:scaffold137701_cov13-Tisochrysis_lutea.AAC.1